MLVVSGCPRSGTSLMMRLMRDALGEDRIIGSEFPQKDRLTWLGKTPETPEEECQHYIAKKRNPDEKASLEKAIDMNPNGFWECPWTVSGIQWSKAMSAVVNGLRNEGEHHQYVCKIVSQGLAKSMPEHVGKVVYMLRNPVAVAKSQERLNYQIELPKDDPVHTPGMFIKVHRQAARWFVSNPSVPVMVVNYDDLIDSPVETLKRVAEFTGQEGDWDTAASVIDSNLRRSKPEPKPSELWDDAWEVHDRVAKADWRGINNYFEEKKRAAQEDAQSFLCTRRGQPTNHRQCNNCYSNPAVSNNFRKTAKARRVDWENEPCVYECGMGPDSMTPITISASIENNFWVRDIPLDPHPTPDKPKLGRAKLNTMQMLKGASSMIRARLGIDVVSDEVMQERMKTCENCPDSQYLFGICAGKRGCKCVLADKVRLKKESCPLGHWDKEGK